MGDGIKNMFQQDEDARFLADKYGIKPPAATDRTGCITPNDVLEEYAMIKLKRKTKSVKFDQFFKEYYKLPKEEKLAPFAYQDFFVAKIDEMVAEKAAKKSKGKKKQPEPEDDTDRWDLI
jgi:hypothetical protein